MICFSEPIFIFKNQKDQTAVTINLFYEKNASLDVIYKPAQYFLSEMAPQAFNKIILISSENLNAFSDDPFIVVLFPYFAITD